MEIETIITPHSGNYKVQIKMAGCGDAPVSGCEMDRLRAVGEPRVDMGGLFEAGEICFRLPSNPISIPSQLPYAYCFTKDQYGDRANSYAVVFKDTIKNRISLALGELMAADIGTVGREVSNLSPAAVQKTPSNVATAAWMCL